jgi:hypothetical protein
VEFDDGAAGEIDVRTVLRTDGVFAQLADPQFVARATVDAELGTLTWPGGLDLDPLVLYAAVTGRPLASLLDGVSAPAS